MGIADGSTVGMEEGEAVEGLQVGSPTLGLGRDVDGSGLGSVDGSKDGDVVGEAEGETERDEGASVA